MPSFSKLHRTEESSFQNKRLKQLYSELQEDINKTSQEEYKHMIRYLSQQKVNDKFAIVDIGWSGGMQRFLEQTLDKLHIEHEIYGEIKGTVDIKNEEEVTAFLNKVEQAHATLLSSLTDGIHLHTIQYPSEETLVKIKHALSQAGILLEDNE